MSSAVTQEVDCSTLSQTARESFECTENDDVRDTISTMHFFVMFGVLFLSFVIVQVTLQVSKRLKTKRLRKIPPDELPLTRETLSKKMFKLVMGQFVRAGEGVAASPPVDYEKLGWRDNRTHYKTSIAYSNALVEEASTVLGDRYTRKPDQSVREFIENLKTLRIPLQLIAPGSREQGSVPPDDDQDLTFEEACDFYIRMYEEAKFGRREFTAEEYNQFLWRTFRLVVSIKT